MQNGDAPFSLIAALFAKSKERICLRGLIDRRPFELPLDRRYYADLRVTPGAKGGFHRAHLHSASPAVPSICIQYCGFMSLCQRELPRRGCWPVVAGLLWKPISISLAVGLKFKWIFMKLSCHAWQFELCCAIID